MNRIMFVAALSLLVPCVAFGQTIGKKQKNAAAGNTAQTMIEKLAEKYAEAARKGDAAFFENNLTRDYIGIEGNGHMSTKPEVLALYKSGQTKFELLDIKDRRARLYGNSAVVISELAIKGHNGPEELNGTYRSTCVLQRGKDGKWRSVSSQLTKVQ